MRKTWLLSIVILVVGPLAASAQQPQDSPDAERQIRAALAHWVEAANRQDWKAALQVWAPDLIGWYPGAPDDTYEREAKAALHPPKGRSTFQVTINEVIVETSLAVVRDTWVITSIPDVGDPVSTTIKSFEVWRRQPDGSWRICRWISAPEPTTRAR